MAWSIVATRVGHQGLRCQVVRAVVPEVLGELAGPAWGEVVLVVEVRGDGGGEVAADPPPERGGGVVVGKVALGQGGAQQGGGVEAGAGDRGEPVGQVGGVGVAAEDGGEGVEERPPLRQSRRACRGEP